MKRSIFVSYVPEDCQEAEKLIAALSAAGFHAAAVSYEAVINVPPRLFFRIFGYGGSGLLRLRDQMGVQVYLDLKDNGSITIKGKSKSNVSRTVSLIRAKMGPPIFPAFKQMRSPDVQIVLLTGKSAGTPQLHQDMAEAIQENIPLLVYAPERTIPSPGLAEILAAAQQSIPTLHTFDALRDALGSFEQARA